MQSAGSVTQQVDTWHMFGLAGVFVLLGLWPRRLPGLWELPIANKAGLTIAEALLIGKHAVGARLARSLPPFLLPAPASVGRCAFPWARDERHSRGRFSSRRCGNLSKNPG